MFDQILASQLKLIVDFNRKLDVVYTNLNTKFETLSKHVKNLEMQVVPTGQAVKGQEALVKGK